MLLPLLARITKHTPAPRIFRRHASADAFTDLFIANTLRSSKSAAENEYVRCTVYNHLGEMEVHGLHMRRPDFMNTYHVAARDLRKMVRSHIHHMGGASVNMEFVPLLVTRPNCIMLNLLNIRALIKCNQLVIFEYALSNTFSESHSTAAFLKQLPDRLRVAHPDALTLPYEFRALEAILVDVASNLSVEMNVHKTVVSNILASLDSSIEQSKLRYLLIQSKKLAQFHQKAKLIQDLLLELLDHDDELNSLYLTELLRGAPRETYHHQEIELLLESYYAAIHEIIQTVEDLSSQIKTSEEIIKFVLDANRNDLMLFSLKITVGLLSIGVTMYIAALYGANLENFIEETNEGFPVVVAVATIAMVALFYACKKQLNRLQRVTMSNLAKR